MNPRQFVAAGGVLQRGTVVYVLRSAARAGKAIVWRVTPSGLVDVVYPHWVTKKEDGSLELKEGFEPTRFDHYGHERGANRQWGSYLDFDVAGQERAERVRIQKSVAIACMNRATEHLRGARGEWSIDSLEESLRDAFASLETAREALGVLK